MATLVLTTIGTIVGGPIGGAIGAILGQQVDQRLFAPKGRHGPRLNDLTLQTSTYGQPIPKLFGRMRAAGTVIWATDLREDRHRSGGGKGKPKTTTYSYSASFAVALSARPIRAVHRIWADGKLLRGAAGDWKSETGFRLYLGGEDQDVDPLIASAEGAEGTPAFRGTAYAMFEDFQLADYGNHIPSLTFEVEADDGAVAIGAIAEALSGGAVRGDTAMAVDGYAASGDSVRGAIEALATMTPLSVTDDGIVLRLTDEAPAATMLTEDELGAVVDGKQGVRRTIDRQAAGTLPDEIAIAYYEPARDYQAGLQRARRGGPGRRVEKIELPAALSTDAAKACAERRLATSWSERAQATLALPWRRMDLRPGGRVNAPELGGPWRIAGWTLDRMVAELKLVGVSGATSGAGAASAGRATAGADGPHGPTVLHLLDLPPLIETGNIPRLWIAAAGPEPGWRRAELSVSLDDGVSWTAIGTTAPPATMGQALGVLGAGSGTLFDRANSVEVELLHDGMWLESCSNAALVAGENIAMLGEELIQFGSAVQTGSRRFLLSNLLRGRRGSEWAMSSHAAGERFVLIEDAALRILELTPAAVGITIKATGIGVGDGGVAVEAECGFAGRALRPPAPVHLFAYRLADGTIRTGWTRRSRTGWTWLDGGDAPLGEEAERYRLVITPSTGTPRTIDLDAPGHDYSPAEQAADGSAGAMSVALSVAQLGSVAASLPAATATFTL